MVRGSKAKYTDKQKRMAEHIEEGYEKKGVGGKEAAKRAWATVNKTTGGGEKSGSGRKKSAKSKARARKSSAKNAATTRKTGKRQAPTASQNKSRKRNGKSTGKTKNTSRSKRSK